MFGSTTHVITNSILDIGTRTNDEKKRQAALSAVTAGAVNHLSPPMAFDLPNVSDVRRIYIYIY
jgi:hypothetical protein